MSFSRVRQGAPTWLTDSNANQELLGSSFLPPQQREVLGLATHHEMAVLSHGLLLLQLLGLHATARNAEAIP